jgi:fatty acid desaturase
MITNPVLPETSEASFPKLISGVIHVFLILAVLYFLFFFFTGAFTYISSGSDEKKVQMAKSQLTNSIIGLAIIFLVFVTLQLLGSFFGIDNILEISLPNLL